MENPIDNYFKFTVLILAFLLLAFDFELAVIYFLLIFADWVWSKSDDFISFPGRRKGANVFRIYAETAIAFAVFIFSSTFIINFLSPQSITGVGAVAQAQSIFTLLATSTPILQGSTFLTFIGWGILVPVIETSFFNGRLLEGFSTYAKDITGKAVNLNKATIGTVIVIFLVASLFTLLHITAKGLSSTPLIITFIFSVISSILVIRHKELRGAIMLHIAVNVAAVASLI